MTSNSSLTLFDVTRSMLGSDKLLRDLQARFYDQSRLSYPPCNLVKKTDNDYVLEVAVTGFDPADVSVEVDNRTLTVEANKTETDDSEEQYVFRGLAARSFTRSWSLAEHMEVGKAAIKNGVLSIELTRVIPDALKPRPIQITVE